MERELNGRAAIVTGGAQGIGACIARAMRREGADIVVADINEEGAKAFAEELGEGCLGTRADVSNMDDLDALVDLTMEHYGKIDILVNNAGISRQVDFLEITKEEFDHFIQVNLDGMVFLTQKVMKHMIDAKYGRIVNIASMAGERGGMFAGIHYSTSKAGVIVATKCMAMKGGQYNITANAIAPGLIKTALAEKLKFSTDEVPMKRLGLPEEVAEVAAFLASDRASYVSGMTVDVNGGQFMR